MKKEFLNIDSKCDGLPLATAIFIPEGECRGIVQFSHGMAEHKERYYEAMEYLCSRGYAAVINDHRGHGESVRASEDLGYFYDDKGEYIVEDLHDITLYMKRRFPSLPVFLVGHSMGSLAVRKYLKKYDADIEKLVVCGSPSKNPLVGLALAIVAFQRKLKGERHRSMFIQILAFGSYTKNIENPVSRTAWISANEDNVREYDKDPLCGFVFTLNGFRNLFILMKEVYQRTGWKVQNPDLPIHFIAGADDPVITSEKSWKEAQDFLKDVGYSNVTGKLYDGLRHELLKEESAGEILEDIVNFFAIA